MPWGLKDRIALLFTIVHDKVAANEYMFVFAQRQCFFDYLRASTTHVAHRIVNNTTATTLNRFISNELHQNFPKSQRFIKFAL